MVLFCLSCTRLFLFQSKALNTLFTISLAKPFNDNVFQNLTQYEAEHYHRIGYLKSFYWINVLCRDESFRFRNPFYVSPFQNLLEFLHISGTRWNETDLFSLVYVDKKAEQAAEAKPTSNVVVDTIRLVSGIPTSRMNDIMEESMEESVITDVEAEEPLYQ